MNRNHESPSPSLMYATSLLGNNTYKLQDENLSVIEEFVLDINTGETSYAILSFGGFLGMSDKLLLYHGRH